LLLHEQPSTDLEAASAEEIQAIIAEYTAWRDGLVQRGQFVGGEKLTDEGGKSLVLVDGQVQVTDGPYAEAKEVMGGYFVISANDYAAAAKIAETGPHLKYGGRIELRQIDEIDA